MPKTVDIESIGQVDFPDSMSDDEILSASQKLVDEQQSLQSQQSSIPQVAAVEPKPNTVSRSGAEVFARSAAETGIRGIQSVGTASAGALIGTSLGGPIGGIVGLLGGLAIDMSPIARSAFETGKELILGKSSKELEAQAERDLKEHPVPAFLGRIAGMASTFRPSASGTREFIDAVKSMPGFLKLAKADQAEVLGHLMGPAIGTAQTAVGVARNPSEYDPTTQQGLMNLGESAFMIGSTKQMPGAIIGGALANLGTAAVGLNPTINALKAKSAAKAEAKSVGAEATAEAIDSTQIDTSSIQQEVERLNALVDEAKGLQAQGQALTDEQAKQIAVLEKSRPKGEMIEATVEQPVAPDVEPAQPNEQNTLTDEQPTTQQSNANQITANNENTGGMTEPVSSWSLPVDDVKPGYVRLYHGGVDPTGDLSGPRWVSQYPDYARGYADKNNVPVWYVDVPETSPYLKKSFDDTGLPYKSPYINVELPADVMAGAKMFALKKSERIKQTQSSNYTSQQKYQHADQITISMETAGSKPSGPAPQVAEGIHSGDVQASGTKVEEKGAGVQSEVKEEVQSTEKPLMFEGGWVSSEPEPNPATAPRAYDGEPVTGTKNAIVDAERLIRGAAAIAPEEVQGNEETLRKGIEIAQDDPQRVDDIIEKLQNREHRSISVEDEAALVARKLILMNKRSMIESVILDPNASTEQKAIAQAEWDALETEMDRMDRATKASGAEWGRFGQFRSRSFREDYSLEPMLRRKRVALDRPLTVEEAQQVKDLSEKILAKDKEIEELRKAAQEKQSAAAFDEAFKRIEQEESATEKETTNPRVVSLAERIVKALEDQAGKARIRLREKLARASSGIDPTILSDVVIIGTAKLARGALDFARWSTSMKEDLGEKVDPYLEEAWKQSNEALDKQVDSMAGKDTAKAVKAALKPSTPVAQIDAFNTRLKEKVANGSEFEDVSGSLEKLARYYWKSGLRSREGVIDRVWEDVKAVLPSITRRNVMDAISGYGKYTELSKDEADVSYRQAKGEMQQLGKIEDMKAGIAPKKTGVERREPNPEERRLIKEVNELKKQGGFIITDPQRQLKTAMDAVKTRLRNEIVDLDKALEKNEMLVKKKSSLEYDQEAKDLRARRDELKKQYDEMFKNSQQTMEEKIARANKVLDETIRRLTEGDDIKKAKAEKISTPEIEAKRARIEELRAVKDFLAKADVATREKQAVDRLESKKVALEKAIDDAKTSPSSEGMGIPKEKPLTTQKIESLRNEIKAMQKELSEIQRGPLPTEEEVALKRKKDAVRKAIENRRKQLEFSQNDKTGKPEIKVDDELELLNLEKESLDEEFRVIKRLIDKTDVQGLEKKAIERLSKRKDELLKRVEDAKKNPSSEGMDLPKEKPLSTPAIDALREEIKGIQKELDSIQRGPLPTEDEVAIARKKAGLARSIAKYKERIANGQFTSKPKPDVKTDDEIRLLTLEQNKVKKEFNEGLLKDRLSRRSVSQVIIDTARESANVIRNMMTGYEFSAVGKQGLFFTASHPLVAMKAMGDMFRALSSESKAAKVMEDIADRPNADLYKQSKLFLADTDSHSLNKVEEAYLGRWASKLPLNTAFQRAFTVFLNKMRADVFDIMAASVSAGDRGLTIDQAKAIANFVNVATGRGSLGSFEASAKNLATIFFAPRYSVSRFQLLLGQPFMKGGGAAVKKAIAAEYARAAIGIAAFTAMVAAYYDNDPIELDPRSSDFLKIKVGKTRIDPYAGLAQATTFLWREHSGYTKNSKGRLVPIRGKVPYGQDDAFKIGTRFLRTKLSPMSAAIADLYSGHDMLDNPVTPKDVLVRSVIPITYGDVYQAIKEHGFNEKSLPMIMMSLFGVGMNTYQDRPKK